MSSGSTSVYTGISPVSVVEGIEDVKCPGLTPSLVGVGVSSGCRLRPEFGVGSEGSWGRQGLPVEVPSDDLFEGQMLEVKCLL